jgi:uncharacterized iron-regulated membrane protein
MTEPAGTNQTFANMKNHSAPTPKPKHRLLNQSRQWHKWGGLVAGLFLLIVGATGIVLNYKQPIFSALGLEKKFPKPEPGKGGEPKTAKAEFSTGTGLAGLPVSLERALEIARAEWGDVRLERIELKTERGETLYKIKQKGGSELLVNAATGTHFTKGEYERVGKAGADGTPVRATDWGKIMIDLHTGKIGGEVGKAIMTIAAVLLLLLTLSGVYMWLKPLLIRRQNAQAKARATAVTLPAPVVTASATARAAKPELVEA